MPHSTDRILTSHVGSLARPAHLLELYGGGAAPAQLEPGLRSAVAEIVREQALAGVDLVNDGEFGHPMSESTDYSAWTTYVYDRLGGFEVQDADVGQAQLASGIFQGRDWKEFADFYRDEGLFPGAGRTGIGRVRFYTNTGPITYKKAQVQRDVANLNAALQAVKVEGAFMNAIVPTAGNLFSMQGGKSYYKSADEQAVAMADALHEEYLAVIGAGIDLQIDDPWLTSMYSTNFSHQANGMQDYLKWAAAQVELVNYALRGIPEERVRYHVCWGSWHGPHISDVPLEKVAPLLVGITAGLYSIEAANVRHGHEWKVWRDIKLPAGKALMPGVVTHSTNVLEHPELIADRIVRYADVVGRENVIAGTDCGLGGRLHPQLLWAKLRALREGAALASERLWG